jgi:hypothetical protein
MAHVKAMEAGPVANKRFLLTAGYFCNKAICEVIRKRFPEYREENQSCECQSGGYPKDGVYKFDNSRATVDLDLTYRTLDESVTPHRYSRLTASGALLSF